MTLPWEDTTELVQMMVITIDGKQYACIGPVLHVPSLGMTAGEVEEIEFGELIPVKTAAELLCGSWRETSTVQ